MKSTEAITYIYDVEGHELAISRCHIGTAYPVNGNVHNPTEYFNWSTATDGKPYLTCCLPTRAQAYEEGRAKVLGIDYWYDERRPGRCKNVRDFNTVRDEMKANYRSRTVKESA